MVDVQGPRLARHLPVYNLSDPAHCRHLRWSWMFGGTEMGMCRDCAAQGHGLTDSGVEGYPDVIPMDRERAIAETHRASETYGANVIKPGGNVASEWGPDGPG